MSVQQVIDIIGANTGSNHVVFPNSRTQSNYVVLLDDDGRVIGAIDENSPLVLSRRGMFSHYVDVYEAANRKSPEDFVEVVRKHDGELETWVNDYTVSVLVKLANDYDNGYIGNEHGYTQSFNDDEQMLFRGLKPMRNDELFTMVGDEQVLIDDALSRFPVDTDDFGKIHYHNNGKVENQDTDEEVIVDQAGKYDISVGGLSSYANGFLMSRVYKVVFDHYVDGTLDVVDENGNELELETEPPYTGTNEVNQTKIVKDLSDMTTDDEEISERLIETASADNAANSGIDEDDMIDLTNMDYDESYDNGDTSTDGKDDYQGTESEDDESYQDDDWDSDATDTVPDDDWDGTDETVIDAETDVTVEDDVQDDSTAADTDTVEETQATDGQHDGNDMKPFQRITVDSVSDDEVSGLVSAVRRATGYSRALIDENKKLNEQIESMTKRSTDEVKNDIENVQRRINSTNERIETTNKEINDLKAKLANVEAEATRLGNALDEDTKHADLLRNEYDEAVERDGLIAKYHKNQKTLDEIKQALA